MTKAYHSYKARIGAKHVAVDASCKEKAEQFNCCLNQLQECGWQVSGESDSIQLIESAQFSQEQRLVLPAIVRCDSVQEAIRLNAIDPQPFNILSVLGYCQLEQALADSVTSELAVDKVLIGLNWTLVKAGDFCGVARSPNRGTEGARSIRPPEGFVGKTLRELAHYFCSTDSLKRSLGLAAINAWWNREEPIEEVLPYCRSEGGFSAIKSPGEGLVIIGGFRGAQKRLSSSKVIEREPKPGDIAVEEAPQAYQSARQLAITAQTLMNGSLEPILRASHCVPERLLVGPSAPLCPVLFDFGITEISGAVVIDAEAAEQFICESGTMIMLETLAKSQYMKLDR